MDLGLILLAAGACVGLLVILGVVYVLSQRWAGGMKTAARQLAATFGLVDHNPDGIYPDLRGEVEGVPVVVDVYFQSYATSRGTSERPWTRVRADLPFPTSLQVRWRGQEVGTEIVWPARPTGDAAFDEKYELFLLEGVPLAEALPDAAREALVAADPPVHILEDAVLWTRPRTTRDAQLLTNAVTSCVRVAKALIG